MGSSKLNVEAITIMDVLGVDLCARAILDRVPLRDLVRSERVSRQWQCVVNNYLHIPTLALTLYDVRTYRPTEGENHRIIEFPRQLYSLPILSRKIEEWGSPIVKVITNRYEEDYFEMISSKCPNLQHVEFRDINKQCFPSLIQALNQIKHCKNLKKISLKFLYSLTNNVIGDVVRNVNCEKVEMDISVSYTSQLVLSGQSYRQPLYMPFLRTAYLSLPSTCGM